MCEFDQSFYNFMEIQISFETTSYTGVWKPFQVEEKPVMIPVGWAATFPPRSFCYKQWGGTSELASPHRIGAWQKFLSHFT